MAMASDAHTPWMHVVSEMAARLREHTQYTRPRLRQKDSLPSLMTREREKKTRKLVNKSNTERWRSWNTAQVLFKRNRKECSWQSAPPKAQIHIFQVHSLSYRMVGLISKQGKGYCLLSARLSLSSWKLQHKVYRFERKVPSSFRARSTAGRAG